MKLILRFLKPHRKLFALTLFLLIVDVAGALLIPTLASEMLREGETGAGMQALINTAVVMAVAAVISGAGGILSGYTCAELVSRVAKDMRHARGDRARRQNGKGGLFYPHHAAGLRYGFG